MHYFILPGYGNSSDGHWQSVFEKKLPNCRRIHQLNWEAPTREDWVMQLQKVLEPLKMEPVVVITHSLGGIALLHWIEQYHPKLLGAFIVAPPDLENPAMDLGLESFCPMPTQALSFPAMMVASSNDPWMSLERSRHFAQLWNCKLIEIGEAGHINPDSGFGNWEEGFELLNSFIQSI
jgi:hypothetical protein